MTAMARDEWGRWWRLTGHKALLHVLSRDWDPIGFGELLPRDEYDCVTGPLATLLRQGAGAPELAVRLTDCRTGHLGLGPDEEADQRAARAVSAWYQTARGSDSV